MDKWDKEERRNDEANHRHTHSDSSGNNNNNNDDRWTPKHHDTQPPPNEDNNKIYTVSQASRLHEGKDISVIGVISGIQPLRKMIKGLSVQCLKCNTTYERKYDKPELAESFVPVERIRKCPQLT